MNPQVWQNRLYAQLLKESQRGTFQRHCAYFAAGWLSLLFIEPKFENLKPASVLSIAGGGLLLVCALVLAGPILNAMRPVLAAAGNAPAITWPVVAVTSFFAWRYAVGRRLLGTFGERSGMAPAVNAP